MCDPNLTLGQVEGFVSSHFWQFLKLGLCKQQVTCPPLALNASTLQNPFTMDLEAGSSSLTPKHSDASNLGHIGVSWPEFSEDETRTSQAKQLWLPCLKGSCISMAWKYVSIIVFQGGDLSSLVKWFFEQRDEHVSKKAASFCTCLCCCWRCMECVLLTVTKKHLCWSWFRISENWGSACFPDQVAPSHLHRLYLGRLADIGSSSLHPVGCWPEGNRKCDLKESTDICDGQSGSACMQVL